MEPKYESTVYTAPETYNTRIFGPRCLYVAAYPATKLTFAAHRLVTAARFVPYINYLVSTPISFSCKLHRN